MVIRFANPGGTAALMTKEAVDHAFGRQQTLVDRARDATRGMSGAQPRLVLGDHGTVQVKPSWIYRIDAGLVFWNLGHGLSQVPGLRRYEDQRCFIRLYDWLPTTEAWYEGFYGELPSQRNPRPDLCWPASVSRPRKMDPSTMRESRCLDDKMHWTARDTWTDTEVMEINDYRARHPVPTEEYQPWPVAVALLQQPFVRFRSERERTEYMAELEGQEMRIKKSSQDNTSVRAGDAPFFDQLIHDAHKKAAETGHRPAKEGDAIFDSELHSVVAKAGTPWGVFCKRQIVDGDGNVSWVIEMWTYRPNGDVVITRWDIYNGPFAPPWRR